MTRWGVEDVQSERMWKQLKRTVHPDATGKDTTELFTWVAQLEEYLKKPKPTIKTSNLDVNSHVQKLAHLGYMNYHKKTGRLLATLDKWKAGEFKGENNEATHTQYDVMAKLSRANKQEYDEMIKFCKKHNLTQAEAECIIKNYVHTP